MARVFAILHAHIHIPAKLNIFVKLHTQLEYVRIRIYMCQYEIRMKYFMNFMTVKIN